MNSDVPSETRVVKRKYEVLSANRPESLAAVPGTLLRILVKAVNSGKQPFLRSATSRSGLPEYSLLKLSGRRLSRTGPDAVQMLMAAVAVGRAVT